MRISLLTYLNDGEGEGSPIDTYVDYLRAARDQGFDFAWTVQLPWEHDALITLAVALREVDGIRVGTGVQPIQLRHPMALAQEALTPERPRKACCGSPPSGSLLRSTALPAPMSVLW